MRKRNHSLCIRMTDEEYSCLVKRIESTGKRQQEYVLDAVLNAEIIPEEYIQEIKNLNSVYADMDRQLRGMGTNLNQMARVANREGILPLAEDLLKISNNVQKMKSEVMQQWQSQRSSINRLNHTEQ